MASMQRQAEIKLLKLLLKNESENLGGEGVANYFFVISNYPWFIFSLEQT